MLRLGSDLPPQSTVGALGVKEGELGRDRPRRSGCRDEPEKKPGNSDATLPKQPQISGVIAANQEVASLASIIHLSQ